MKHIILTLILVLSGSFAFADTFETITKNNEVVFIEQVQVKRIIPSQIEEILTLAYINTQIAVIKTKITKLEQDLAEIEALKLLVEDQAQNVILKEP